MVEKIEDQVHELDEKRKTLDQAIESLKEEISIIDCRIIIIADNFRAQRNLKLSISGPRSETILEKITNVMEKMEEEKAEASQLRKSLSKELKSKMKERDFILQQREKM